MKRSKRTNPCVYKISHVLYQREEQHRGAKMVHVCSNGTMENTSHYSSPVPLVGLYIAAAGFVCCLLILCDMWAGFRRKKFWLPCRFFSINSITLTLISIATKLPVDLTTPMPRAQDQLSKLSGTVFICVAMSFMLPSLAVNAEFESYANVTALTIFVVTVVVNICIQIATGVIFSFFTEHILILVCMLMLLIRFWSSVAYINSLKEYYTDTNKIFIKEGGKSLLRRLELCYLYGYLYCLQLLSCRAPFLADVALVCITCSGVLIQAMLRSIGLKDINFCVEASDYGWSMWLVVVSQVFTVAVVSLAVGIRWLNNLVHFQWLYDVKYKLGLYDPYLKFRYLFSLRSLPKFLEKSFRYVIYFPLVLVDFSVAILNVCIRAGIGHGLLMCGIMHEEEEKTDVNLQLFMRDLRSGLHETIEMSLLKKSVVDMERWMEINRKASFNNLPNMSSSPTVRLDVPDVKISSLSMVLLVEMAKSAMMTPTSLDNVLDKAFDIIHFIDSKLNVGSSKDRLRSMSAQIIHEYGLGNGDGEIVLEELWQSNQIWFKFISKTICWKFDKLSSESNDAIQFLLNALGSFINYQPSESREVAYGRIHQLFVHMLHSLLAHLPVAIFTHIVESPVEEYQDRVRLCLGFLCRVQSLEPHITFSLPRANGITDLFGTETQGRSLPQALA